MEGTPPPRSILLATAALVIDQLGLGLVVTDEIQGQRTLERPAGYLFRAYSARRSESRSYAMTWRSIPRQHRIVILSLVEAPPDDRPRWAVNAKAALGSSTVAHFGNDYHYGLLLSKEIILSDRRLNSPEALDAGRLSAYPEVPALWFGHRQVDLPSLALAEKVRTALLGGDVFVTDDERKRIPWHIMARLALVLVPVLNREPRSGRYQLVRSPEPLSFEDLSHVA